jgi:hypothetical protein
MKSWAVPAAIIVSIEYAFALIIGARVGFHYSIPFSAYLVSALVVIVAAFVILLALRLIAAARSGDAPLDLYRGAGFALGVILVGLQMAVLSWTKIMLPIASPFWADPLLANVDQAIFRSDPWQLAQALVGWAAPAIDRAYVTWAPIKFAALTILLLLPESVAKKRALVSYFLILSCVALGQFMLSSAGPIFYAELGLGDRFGTLPIEPWVLASKAYLWSDYLRAGGDIGTGISAMPSLHVAIALWIAFVVQTFVRRFAVFGYIYFALILVGSVLLGWHYAVDGAAAIGITLVAWKIADYLPSREGDKIKAWPRTWRTTARAGAGVK